LPPVQNEARPLASGSNVPSDQDILEYLNDVSWGKQANVHFTIIRYEHDINYDLNRDGMLGDPEISGWNEVNAVRAVRAYEADYNIYYVHSYEIPIGMTIFDETFTQGTGPGGPSVENHLAHEVGHLLGIVDDSTDERDLMYRLGLSSDPCRIVRRDWDIVNP
jgi:hypothetical protein